MYQFLIIAYLFTSYFYFSSFGVSQIKSEVGRHQWTKGAVSGREGNGRKGEGEKVGAEKEKRVSEKGERGRREK